MNSTPLARLRTTVWRIIPTRFPPVDLFREVASAEDWSLLQEFEGLTNSRLVEQELSRGLVRTEDRIEKSSSHYILGPLTHPNPDGSRFSDGAYGVLYAALDFDTAVAEVKQQREAFMAATGQKPQRIDMRVILMNLDGDLHDLRGSSFEDQTIEGLKRSREAGAELRSAGSNGIIFESSLRLGGTCVAVFRPPVLTNCRQERHFGFIWDGSAITDVYEYARARDAV